MTDASWIERSVLIALMAASLTLFWLRFRKVLEAIRGARATPDFEVRAAGPAHPPVPLGGDGARQGDRPAAPARPRPRLRLLGFLRLRAGHCQPLRKRVRRGLSLRQTAFGRFYLGFVAVWAVAVAVAIAGLFIRRFFVRPVWLGELSPESGVVALLIFLLMATWLGRPVASAGHARGQGELVGAHAGAGDFPAADSPHQTPAPGAQPRDGVPAARRLQPHSAARRATRISASTGKDVTRIDALQAYTCVECGRCTEHCPAFNTGKVLNPKEIILGLRGYLNQFGPAGEAALLGRHISEEAVVPVHHLRRLRVSVSGGHPAPAGDRGTAARRREHRPVGGRTRRPAVPEPGAHRQRARLPRRRAPEFIEKNGLPIYDGTQAYCLWLGCMGAYDPQGREIVLALARVLRHAGVTFGVLRKEKCTGDAARRLGNDLAVSQLAEANIETLRAAGVGKMVSICPHCVRTIGTDWREYGATFEIEHHSELLARLPLGLPTPPPSEGQSGLPRPLLPGPLPQRIRRSRARRWRASPKWWTRAARASVPSVAAPAAARCSWARRRASASTWSAPKSWWPRARRRSARPVRSASRCSATRWARWRQRRRSCWTSRRSWRRAAGGAAEKRIVTFPRAMV
jgi:ferredoxin